MNRRLVAPLVCALFGKTLCAAAQSVRTTVIVATSDSGVLTSVVDVRGLSDGRVLVNDRTRRRIVLFDSSLRAPQTILGDGAGSLGPYVRPGRLLAYRGDSAIFADLDARAFVLIGPAPSIVKSVAPVRMLDLPRIGTVSYGTAGFDPAARIIYQGATVYPPGTDPNTANVDTTKLVTLKTPTTGPIVRANFDTRGIDTLAWLQLPFEKSVQLHNASMEAFNPLPMADDWTVMADGTIAIVRAHDYHIDLVHPDGTVSSTPKVPFDWRSISAEEKEHIRDSVKAFYDAEIAKRRPPPSGQAQPPFTIVDAADLPDFYPPIRQGTTKADPQGNLWIVPSTTRAESEGLVYDVVRKDGSIVERVRLPAGRVLAGFGAGGVLYLRRVVAARDERLERAGVVR